MKKIFKQLIEDLKQLPDNYEKWDCFKKHLQENKGEWDVDEVKIDANHLYVVAADMEVLLVMVDMPTEVVLADEAPFEGCPTWFTESGHYRSPVFLLTQAMKHLRESNEGRKEGLEVSGLLLCRSHIINHEDMVDEPTWKELDLVASLHMSMESAADFDLTKCFLVSHSSFFVTDVATFIRKKLVGRSIEEEDEFTKMLDDFLNDSYEGKKASHPVAADILAEGEKRLTTVFGKLDRLVGLEDIKTHMRRFADFALFNRMTACVSSDGLPIHPELVKRDAIFLGNPGTGKTTVAMLYADLLHSIGLLKSNFVKVVSRAEIISTLYGGEEKNMVEIVNEMENHDGGVLFIDEAYSLFNTADPRDPGRNVIAQLMRIHDLNPDIVIILAGYEREMQPMLNFNTGFKSRFANVFHFSDFSIEQLLGMAKAKLAEKRYRLSPKAQQKLKENITAAYNEKNAHFGNGRFIDGLLEQIYLRHARRIVRNKVVENQKLLYIRAEDIPEHRATAVKMPLAVGFR